MKIPRSEYPRPQFVREDWLCLNGPWQFEVDAGDSGLQRGLVEKDLAEEILVPFCPECELSGIARVDFLNAVWYRREVQIPPDWRGRKVLLHFQGVDYDATVWVNGQKAGEHRGGFSPFACDLSGLARPGEQATIVLRARDDHRQPKPQGKQEWHYHRTGCLYNRTTGIWQSVWMEPVPETHLMRPKILPDLAGGRFLLTQKIQGPCHGLTLRAVLSDQKGRVAEVRGPADSDMTPQLSLEIPEDRRRPWSPEDPHLYQLELELLDDKGDVVDRARSYAGLRSVAIRGKAVLLNGKPVFQRLVLDQGFYPDGLMTAGCDEDLIRDIQLSMEAGFNGARLHQKVFEERFLYHADRLGYLCWGEFADWFGHAEMRKISYRSPSFVAQWLEVLERDVSHPCIVGWCPLNETHDRKEDDISDHDDLVRALFLATKAADPTRPVLDTSGYSHRIAETDVYDSHDYTQDPAELARRHDAAGDDRPFINDMPSSNSQGYRGQPYFISEFGGIWWNAEQARQAAKDNTTESWGYGKRPATIEEFYQRFEGQVRYLLGHPGMFGYCYTQLTDVFQEQNGIYHFDRSPKFDADRLRQIQRQTAAIEQTQ
jgi:beta-galactosidase/beta-glucuronidase